MFKKGQSGNPGGMRRGFREARASVAEKLDKAFVTEEGRDLLVEAIVAGVATGDSVLTKLAAEYRWGKPAQPIEGDLAIGSASAEQLIKQIPEALQILRGGK